MTTMPPRSSPAGGRPLRIVLLGLPGSGKTTFLTNLPTALAKQPRLLGSLSDSSPNASLCELITQNASGSIPTVGRTNRCLLTLTSGSPADARGLGRDVEIVECAGDVLADALVQRRLDLPGLREALTAAEAIVYFVDASAPAEQVETDLRDLERFLDLLTSERSRRCCVGGLPILVTLHKVDRLVEPGEDFDRRAARLSARRRGLADRLTDYLPNGRIGFGSVIVYPATTACDRSGSEAEPLGIAALLAEAITAAERFRASCRIAERRLVTTTLAVALLLPVLAATIFFALTMQPKGGSTGLLTRFEAFRANEPRTAGGRFTESRFERALRQLTDFASDPEAVNLPEDVRLDLARRLSEYERYRDFREALFMLPAPASKRTLEQLRELETALQNRTIPTGFEEAWADTEAVRLRSKWLADIDLMRRSVVEVRDWYQRNIITEAIDLLAKQTTADGAVDPTWSSKVDALLKKPIPFRETERLPNAQALPGPRGAAVTYAAILAFDEIARLRDEEAGEWVRLRRDLETLRDLLEAVGVVANEAVPERAVLVLPPLPGPNDLQVGTTARLKALRRYFPNGTAQWKLDLVPTPLQPTVRRRLTEARERLLQGWHAAIRSQVPNDTPETWRRVADRLEAQDLRDAREFTMLIERLLGRSVSDPVAHLSEFLRRESFELKLSRFDVSIPESSNRFLTPSGKLNLVLVRDRDDSKRQEATFTLINRASVSDNGKAWTKYTFQLDGRASDAWLYRPGNDFFRATLRLKDGNEEWQFTWAVCRTERWQFEKLSNAPFLHVFGREAVSGSLFEGVIVTADAWPTVPDLLPTLSR